MAHFYLFKYFGRIEYSWNKLPETSMTSYSTVFEVVTIILSNRYISC